MVTDGGLRVHILGNHGVYNEPKCQRPALGTLYNFRFVAPRKLVSTSTITVYPFKTGTPSSVTGTSLAPNADPLRACCYGGDSCEVDTEDECDGHSGYWTNSTSCYTAGCAMRPGE